MTDVKGMNVSQLKVQLKSLGLSVKGKKADLCKRLLSYRQKHIDINGEKTEPVTTSNNNCLKVSDFDMYVNEYEAFKQFVTGKLAAVTEKLYGEHQNTIHAINELKLENEILKNELKNKQAIIDILQKENPLNQSKMNRSSFAELATTPTRTSNNDAVLHQNRFASLENEPSYDVLTDSSFQRKVKSRTNPFRKVNNDSVRRNGFPVDQNPETHHNNVPPQSINHENSVIHSHQEKISVPGRSSYANIVSKGKKIAIYGDSMVKRIRANEFNKYANGDGFIKSFPGAKATELSHYIEYSLNRDKPDCVVIHCGTNNLNRNNSMNNNQIANDIVDIARKCRRLGVNNIFLSGIIVRNSFAAARKLRDINEQVREMCINEKFNFICNDNITREFLSTDGIHLIEQGTNLLANNFLNAINTI